MRSPQLTRDAKSGGPVSSPVFRRTQFAFLWIAVIPIVLTAVALTIGGQFQTEIDWIAHTYQVRNALRECILATSAADRDLRNYLLTGQAPYLVDFQSDSAQAPKRLEEVRRLTADNPAQQRHIARLEPLVSGALAGMQRILSSRQAGSGNRPLTSAEIEQEQQLMDHIRDVSRDMMQEEERLFLARGQRGARLLKQLEVVFGGAIFLTLLLLYLAGKLAKANAGQRDRAESALQQR